LFKFQICFSIHSDLSFRKSIAFSSIEDFVIKNHGLGIVKTRVLEFMEILILLALEEYFFSKAISFWFNIIVGIFYFLTNNSFQKFISFICAQAHLISVLKYSYSSRVISNSTYLYWPSFPSTKSKATAQISNLELNSKSTSQSSL
jgi:hypothetical protein